MAVFQGETFLIRRCGKASSSISLAWAYPNSYAIGMAGLGYQLVWRIFEENPGVCVRRVFTDKAEEGWQSSELLGFTLSWELDYANILQLLKENRIEALSRLRNAHDPLIFGGGPVLSANPEPFADFFDVILTGDAEATVPAFIEAWKECRNLPDRKQQLLHLATIPGIYVPSLYSCRFHSDGTIEKLAPIHDNAPEFISRAVYTPPADYVAHSVILSDASSWSNMFLVEVARSCPQECRFCLASYLTRPFRAANVDTLLEKIELGLKHTRKIGLLGPSVTEHPAFAEIANRLLAKQLSDIELSLASIRMDTIDPLVLQLLTSLGQRSVTIALESGSERLRAIMKKNLSEPEVYSAMEMIDRSGLESIKFYGMVGLPGEIQDDLDETVRLLTALKKKHKRLRLAFGVSSFVPKAQTPFQWSGRDQDSGEKIEYLRKKLSKCGIDVRPESHNWSDVQAYISRGDRRISKVLLEVAQSSAKLGAWKKAWRNPPEGCPAADFFIYRNIPYDETLPWTHLTDAGKRAMLHRHSQTAAELASVTGK